MIFIFLFFIIFMTLFLGFKSKSKNKVTYTLTTANIDKERDLNWYKKEIKSQINCLLFYPDVEGGNKIKYKAPLLYSVNENYIEVDYNIFYIEITSSKMVQKILENRLEIKNKNWI